MPYHTITYHIGLQRMLDVCLDFSVRNDIRFNPIKSVCVVLYLKVVSCIAQILDKTVIYFKYISCTEYI